MKKLMILSCAATMALCGVQAATIWVDAASSESTTGETLSYQTIEAAVDQATALRATESTVEVRVKDGIYQLTREIVLTNGVALVSENGRDKVVLMPATGCRAVTLKAKGTLAGVTIKGIALDSTTLTSSSHSTGGYAIYAEDGSMVTNCIVRDVTMTLANGSAASGGVVNLHGSAKCYDSVFENCTGPFHVVYFDSGAYPYMYNSQVVGNTLTGANRSAVWVEGAGSLSSCLIARNTMADAAAVTFHVWQPGALLNSTVAGNKGPGVRISNRENFKMVSLFDSVVAGNEGGSIVCDDTIYPKLVQNCAYDGTPSFGNWTQSPTDSILVTEASSLFADVAMGDYHLAEGSSLIDAGAYNSEWLTANSKDLDGRARKIGAAYDIGCYEFDAQYDREPTLKVALVRENGTPQVSSMANAAISFRPNVIWHGLAVTPESVSYLWNGAVRTLNVGASATEAFPAEAGACQVVLQATFKGKVVSNVVEKAFVLVDPAQTVATWCGPDGSNTSPYDTPEKAARRPFDALQVAMEKTGGMVLVMDGDYSCTNTLTLKNAVTLASVAGDPSRVVFHGGTNFRLVNVGANTSYSQKNVLAGVTICDVRATGASDALMCAGVDVRDGLITNCVIRNIGAAFYWQYPSHGAALVLGHGGNYDCLTATAIDCVIEDNASAYSEGGNSWAKNGAAVLIDKNGLMDRCIIRNNKADDTTGASSGDKIYGAGLNMNHKTAICRNTLVADNTSSLTLGGVLLKNGRLENCTIADNQGTANETVTVGGGLYVTGGAVVNTIVSGNMMGTEEVNVSLAESVEASTTFTNCCLKGFAGGPKCLSEDPLLDAQFQPTAKSPVLNAGLKLSWMSDAALDLAHRPRIFQRRPDMGCYEMPFEVHRGLILVVR